MLRKILNSFPIRIKKSLVSWAKVQISEENKKREKFWFDLSPKHIRNAELLMDRKALIDSLPKKGVVGEIGVNKGEFSSQILNKNQPLKLHLVDAWSNQRYHQGIKAAVEAKFSNEIANDLVRIHQGMSTEIVNDFMDSYFDWIYIDTNHSYKTTKEELYKYSSKVKTDGLIAGHDFIAGNWDDMIRYGVIEAVYEFCQKEDWEFIYLTMNHEEHPSFAIRRITK